MMSTESASANLSSQERDIHHLECRRKGIPITELALPNVDNVDSDDSQLSDDLARDLVKAWELLEGRDTTTEPNHDTSEKAETTDVLDGSHDQHHLIDEEAPQESPLPSSVPTNPDPGITTSFTHKLTSPDLIGFSFLGAAVISYYNSIPTHLLHLSISRLQSVLPRPITNQFLATTFFLFVPLYIGIFRSVVGILYWIFLQVEDNILKKVIKDCNRRIRELEVGNEYGREIFAVKKQLRESKERQKKLFGGEVRGEGGKKKKGGGRKKKNVKKEEEKVKAE
ncbi:MAG: hypothetical protein Q9204_005089 [Flavoplaca sp. TL-2023a]